MKRHNRKNYWLVSLALCILMVFTLLPIAAFAAEYPYQYPAEKPYYEMSMYAYKVNAADAESYPTGIFRLLTDDNRTLYAYCADSEIYDIPGTAYKAISLSDHYGAETASTGKLRTIIQNSYPFISMNEMISRIEQSGISLHTASVPCYEMVLISAIQQALYTYTNPDIVIEVQFAGGFPQKVYEMYKPLIYHYNDNYKDKKVTQAYPDIKADVEAVYSWLCALSPSNAPNVPNVNVSFAAEVEQVTSGHVLILYDLFDGFEDYNESLNVYVTEIVGTNENLIFEKPFNEFVPVGEGRYAMDLPNTITGSSLKVTLNGYNDYEDVVIYEAKKAEAETSQPFIGYGKARVPFSKTEQIDMPIQTGSLIVRKTVSGEGSDAHNAFTFTVTLMQNGDTPNGDIVCGDVTFTNGTATFTLKHNESKTIESIPAGFAYLVEESDNGGYAVTVNNTDATTASGIIVAGQTATAAFENSWQGGGYTFPDPASVKLTARKTLDGVDPGDMDFTFQLKDESGAVIQTVNNLRGFIEFEPLVFNAAGIYTYTISEIQGGGAGIVFDPSVYSVKIQVELGSDSYLAEVSYLKDDVPYTGEELVFANTTQEQTGRLAVKKTVSGSGGSTSKAFTFTVTLMQNGDTLNGDIVCGDVTFTNGTSTFTLKHNESKTIESIPAGFTYLVEESGNGGYAVTVNNTDATTASGIIVAGQTATAAFDNYKPSGGHIDPDPNPAKVALTATKTLDGIAPKGSSFVFVLKDENGRIVQTKSNNGDQIFFDTMSFSNTGTYKYTVEEVAGNDRNINYDGNVYTVIIKVTKSGDYHAEISYEKNGTAYQGKLVFANTTKSSPPVIVPDNYTVSVSVSKVWKDGGSSNRPSYVSVQLYRNGNAYGNTVTLSESNSWRYTWSNLDDDYTWTVNEVNVPRGYTRTVTRSGDVWTITNTKPIDKIPQTGDNSNITLWIALACMSAAGMLITLCGKMRINRQRR